MNIPASSICILLLLGACADQEVVAFGAPRRVPESQRPMEWGLPTEDRMYVPQVGPAKQSPTMSGAGGNSGSGGKGVIANTPAGWEELPAQPQKFKDAIWGIKGASETTCYLTVAVGGGVAFNLQRWYVNQFGKAEVPSVAALPEIRFANRSGRLVEHQGMFSGKAEWGAMIAFYNDGNSVTSLKFTGPQQVVQNNRKQFLALAESIRIGAGSPQASAPAIQPGQQMPADHVPINQGGDASAGKAPSPFTAEVPDGWAAKEGRRVLHHTFGQGSEVYVSQLGGTMKQSLDIWRVEMGMGPMSDAEFKALPQALFLGDDAVLMDLSGSYSGMTGAQVADARLLVAARVDGSTITFCKLVGPRVEVGAERDAFIQFCGSMRRKQ